MGNYVNSYKYVGRYGVRFDMNGDKTYCQANCKNKDNCRRNPENRPFKDMPYWVADFSNDCSKYEETDEYNKVE